MIEADAAHNTFNVVIVCQSGRLRYDELLFAASLRASAPDFKGRLLIAEPQQGPLWQDDPRIEPGPVRDLLQELGAEITQFENRHFGQAYPQGNKMEMLRALPLGDPFVIFDTDT